MKLLYKIPYSIAIKTVLVILGMVFIFHGLVLLEVIPYDMVWGGRLTSREEMVRFELSSLFINMFLAWIVASKAGYQKRILPDLLIHLFLWFFVVVFVLNTIGNLLAFNSLETYIFTPITLLLSVLLTRVAIERK